MLLLEKETSSKLWDYLHKRTRKCFLRREYFRDYIHKMLPHAPMRLETLQILELSFSNKELVQFFGMNLVPFRYVAQRYPAFWQEARVLKALPMLKQVFLRFRPPAADCCSDPWAFTGWMRNLYGLPLNSGFYDPDDCDWRGRHYRHNVNVSCQRLLTDWILT